jgi:peptide/nickel transport system substrate-binding protein
VPALEIAIPGPFSGCDPGSPTTSASTDAILSLVLPSAFTSAPNDLQVGNTAVISTAEVVSLAPQTVVYTIAPLAKWSDGAPLTAGDLVRTWEQRRSDRVLADLGYRTIAWMHPGPKGTQVTVRFRSPYSDWFSLFHTIVPASTYGARCATPSAALDPSLGPYEIEGASSGRVDLVANQGWHGNPPTYTHVTVVADPAATPVLAGPLRAVYVPSATLPEVEALAGRGLYDARTSQSNTIVSLDFAVRGPDALPPDVRAGVAHLIDRQAIVNQLAGPVLAAVGTSASHLVGPGQSSYPGPAGVPVGAAPTTPQAPVPAGTTGGAAYTPGPQTALAAQELRASHYSKVGSAWSSLGHRILSVCLAVPSASPQLSAAAVLIAGQLRSEGVQVETRAASGVPGVLADLRDGTCASGLVSKVGDGFYTHEAASWQAPPVPYPAGLAWTGVDDAAASAAARSATSILNPVDAVPYWETMDNRIWDLMAGLPLYSPPTYLGWSPQVTGVLPTDSVMGFVDQVPNLLYTATPS